MPEPLKPCTYNQALSDAEEAAIPYLANVKCGRQAIRALRRADGDYDAIKHAVHIKVAADALHSELLKQCHDLMTSEVGTEEADTLSRIARLVEEYEEIRYRRSPSVNNGGE